MLCDTLNFKSCVWFTLGSLKKKGTTLTQYQKFKNGLKIAQFLASLVSEGGMSTFKRRHKVFESLVRGWKLGREVIVQEVGRTKTKADVEAEDPRTGKGRQANRKHRGKRAGSR